MPKETDRKTNQYHQMSRRSTQLSMHRKQLQNLIMRNKKQILPSARTSPLPHTQFTPTTTPLPLPCPNGLLSLPCLHFIPTPHFYPHSPQTLPIQQPSSSHASTLHTHSNSRRGRLRSCLQGNYTPSTPFLGPIQPQWSHIRHEGI